MGSPTVICHYRVRPGNEAEFETLLRQHWPSLRDLELATESPPLHYAGAEDGVDGPLYVEIFEWTDADAVARAHVHPSINAIWERMGELCEDRAGRPMFEFPHFKRLELR
jgi:hypothetical protein